MKKFLQCFYTDILYVVDLKFICRRMVKILCGYDFTNTLKHVVVAYSKIPANQLPS
jgi:hypothetical protein